MQCGFLHRRSSIGPGPRPCTTKPAINPILSSRSRIATPPPVFLSPSPRPIIISRAATEDEIAAASPALIGEDAAKFEVEKQKASSWALFFGLLTGVLGLLYLVRLAWGSMMTKTRAMDVDCYAAAGLDSARHGVGGRLFAIGGVPLGREPRGNGPSDPLCFCGLPFWHGGSETAG